MPRSIRAIVAVCVLAAATSTVPAAADSHCTVDAGSSATPHLEDLVNDWNGLLLGNGSATIPYGDVYREGTDLTSAWMTRSNGVYTANIQVASLNGLETNARFYFLWTYAGSTPAKARRFVSAQILRPLPSPVFQFRYGYLDESGEIGTFQEEGSATGSFTFGSPSTISITVPMSRLGAPSAGAVLDDIAAEARFLVGAAQAGGLLGVADATDGFPCFSLSIP